MVMIFTFILFYKSPLIMTFYRVVGAFHDIIKNRMKDIYTFDVWKKYLRSIKITNTGEIKVAPNVSPTDTLRNKCIRNQGDKIKKNIKVSL